MNQNDKDIGVGFHEPTSCCGYRAPLNLAYPVYWNPFNRVIQCHNCGVIFLPPNAANNAEIQALRTERDGLREELDQTRAAYKSEVTMLAMHYEVNEIEKAILSNAKAVNEKKNPASE